MNLLRWGVLDGNGRIRDLSTLLRDIGPDTLAPSRSKFCARST